ncbi:MAG: hypothetical protein IJK92_04560 [Bacteroidales bacterium]|nr:hypothetical protein [Bacteroidales bacterium]
MNKELEQKAHYADIKLVLKFMSSKCEEMENRLKDSEIIADYQKELLVENSNEMKKYLEQLTSLL